VLKFKQALAVLNVQGMQGAQVLILCDADVKGYRKKPLSKLQFLYWGATQQGCPRCSNPFPDVETALAGNGHSSGS
jgi:hypothetical protein